MTFTLFSTLATLIGVAIIAAGLALLQRLRVQHREIEVASTLFWQAAVKETRARVFVHKFRHWPAWLLLVLIASLLWILLAGPNWSGGEQMQHVVLLDGSIADPDVAASDLELATLKASKLPWMNREIVLAGPQLQTLLRSGEPVQVANLRRDKAPTPTSTGLEWALESLAGRAGQGRPLTIHIVGDARVDQRYLDALPDEVTVYRVDRGPAQGKPLLRALGVSDAESGVWQTVDLLFAPAALDTFQLEKINVTIDQEPFSGEIQATSGGDYVVKNVPAGGGVLRMNYEASEVGAITLPRRDLIRIGFEAGTPEVLKQLILLDPACTEVQRQPDLLVGESEDADLRLRSEGRPAFQVDTDLKDADLALEELIDELALRQIDATALAQQSGRVIDVQVASSDQRKISVWKNLFSTTYNFQQSRACPIFVARSIRWLANRPVLVPWAEQGMRLPAARPVFDRVVDLTATAADGRTLLVTRLSGPAVVAAAVESSPADGFVAGLGVAVWIGILVVIMLLAEWALYQKGRLP
ncbi:MAG: hypothetical protein CMM01_24905 [Rhodopirellula sp.]|nr:hypothetical protein [Rhodopirellula sp.]